MKVAILSESEDDEEAVRILIDGILGRSTQPITNLRLRARGWPAVYHVLPAVVKHLYYQTDAEALVVVVDSNHSLVHQQTHEQPGGVERECRLCLLRERVTDVQGRLSVRPERLAIKIAIGLAVPAIEAWYRCGRDPQVTEGAWMRGLQSGRFSYSKNSLKKDVYSTERPLQVLKTRRATEEARRLVQDLHQLEASFPNGFGSLMNVVRNWET
jgi:hypothetical protein